MPCSKDHGNQSFTDDELPLSAHLEVYVESDRKRVQAGDHAGCADDLIAAWRPMETVFDFAGQPSPRGKPVHAVMHDGSTEFGEIVDMNGMNRPGRQGPVKAREHWRLLRLLLMCGVSVQTTPFYPSF
ncbi:hypothetical protein N7539_006606 [Penicillium diatomitis]|uniref:Uncharacterized protein n=1 Tax=Penicillium diatomitis TaxID=2819901 RepID=A0A9X0BSF5_9EURO|nr:uncharacterized protein N7539_006606 [Penicillium diatomitis]KAJ5480712.1 hypothetical protein N7539_006606 [Penicillium diatomitis]